MKEVSLSWNLHREKGPKWIPGKSIEEVAMKAEEMKEKALDLFMKRLH